MIICFDLACMMIDAQIGVVVSRWKANQNFFVQLLCVESIIASTCITTKKVY